MESCRMVLSEIITYLVMGYICKPFEIVWDKRAGIYG